MPKVINPPFPEFHLTDVEIKQWVVSAIAMNLPAVPFTEEDTDHITLCLSHLQRRYWEGFPVGDFLQAILRNDLAEACNRADDANLKGLALYPAFMRNHLPGDWRTKVKDA